MSSTELYGFTETSCDFIGETQNSHRGAMAIWKHLAERYLGLKGEHFFRLVLAENGMRPVWNLAVDDRVDHAYRTVLRSTFDRTLLK